MRDEAGETLACLKPASFQFRFDRTRWIDRMAFDKLDSPCFDSSRFILAFSLFSCDNFLLCDRWLSAS